MNTRAWILIGALLTLPALAQERPAAKPPAATQNAPTQPKPTLDLKSAGVQTAIRANAANLQASERANPSDGFRLSTALPQQRPNALESEAAGANLKDIPFRAPRRMHHMDCDSFNCVAYTADDQSLYTVPREQYFGVNTDDPQDAWLSCQSGDDLLTIFERYDKCRGVSIGLPLQIHDVIVNLPKIRL